MVSVAQRKMHNSPFLKTKSQLPRENRDQHCQEAVIVLFLPVRAHRDFLYPSLSTMGERSKSHGIIAPLLTLLRKQSSKLYESEPVWSLGCCHPQIVGSSWIMPTEAAKRSGVEGEWNLVQQISCQIASPTCIADCMNYLSSPSFGFTTNAEKRNISGFYRK